MLRERSRFLQRALFGADMLLIAACWIAAYGLRFVLLHPATSWALDGLIAALPLVNAPQPPPFEIYLSLLPGVLALWGAIFLLSGLYDQTRARRLPLLAYGVARAVFLGFVAIVGALFFYREFSFSRVYMLIFGGLTLAGMVALRLIVYYGLRRARRHGRNQSRVLIVGAGRAGKRLARAFRQYPWMGLDVVGFLDDEKTERPDVLGAVDEAPRIVDEARENGRPIDYVYLALPLTAADRIEPVVDALSTRLAHVCLVPDLLHFDILNSRISDVSGMPVIHLIDEAPLEFRRLMKRVLDVSFSLVFLVVASPLMAAIAGAVKLSSPGPVFYRQERMGLNGERFTMLKFRTMPTDTESETGATWAKKGGDRATRVGRFLRRTSLDELPQFWNVVRGDMAVVGPRPERPVFIEKFRDRVPGYMLRHKTRAGITGWAQVNGWRGNTSLEKRIEHDLYYIQNWSLLFDLKIMWLTLWRGFVHENAY